MMFPAHHGIMYPPYPGMPMHPHMMQQQQQQEQHHQQQPQQPPAAAVAAATYPYMHGSYYAAHPHAMMMMPPYHHHGMMHMPPPMAAAAAPSSPGMPLSLPNDAERLSEYQTILRQQFEFFQAGPLDAQTTAQGRKRPVVIGQGASYLSCCVVVSPRGKSKRQKHSFRPLAH
jgi:hypothetical protein